MAFAVLTDVSADLLGNVWLECGEFRLGHVGRTRFGVDALAQLRHPHRMPQDVIERLHDLVFVCKPETHLTTKAATSATVLSHPAGNVSSPGATCLSSPVIP